jgi:uncharacterized membrane protein YbhN (UPF0104 family)
MHLAADDDGEMVRPPKPSRPFLSWLLLVASLALVVWLFYEHRDELDVLWRIPPVTVPALFGLQGLYLVIQSGRYQVVLEKCSGRRIGFFPWLHLFIVGRFLNLFMPQAGNFFRGFELHRRFDVTVTGYLTALFSAAWIAALLNFALGVLVVVTIRPALQLMGIPMGVVLGLATVLTATIPIAAAHILVRLEFGGRWAWLRGRFAELLHVALRSVRDPQYAVRILAWSVAGFIQAVFLYWVCFAAIRVEIGIAEVVAFFVILQITTFVVITPGNLGIQELAFGALGAGIGAGVVEGVLVSALLRVTGMAAVVALAIPLGGLRLLKATRRSRR